MIEQGGKLAGVMVTLLVAICAGVSLFCAAPARALDPARTVLQYKHDGWTAGDGAPPNIQAIAQTPDGYLWLGTGDGLYRFDGVTFEQVPGAAAGGPGDNRITALMVSRSGDLWVGYYRGTVAVLHKGHIREIGPRDLTAPVFQIVEDRDGHIWLSTASNRQHVWRRSSGRWQTLMDGHGRMDAAISTLLAARDGTVWIATRKKLLFIRRGTTRLDDTGEQLDFGDYLAEDRRGRIWLTGTSKGSRQLPDYPAHERKAPTDARTYPVAGRAGPRVTMFDRDGALWSTTTDGGIMRLALSGGAPRDEAYTRKEGLTSDLANPVFEDREGNIWVGTMEGLDRFRAANVVAEGVTGYLMGADRHGSVYVANPSTLQIVGPGAAARLLRGGLHWPMSMCESADGTMWFGVNGGALALKDGRFENSAPPDTGVVFYDCVQDGKGAMWFTAATGGLYRLDRGIWSHFPLPSSEADSFPLLLAADGKGRVLTYYRNKYLVRIDYPARRILAREADLSIGPVTALYQGPSDFLIAGQFGLARLHGDRLETLSARDYPWLRMITGIVQTARAETWLHGAQGVVRLSTPALDAHFAGARGALAHDLFDTEDGLSGITDPDGRHTAAAGANGRLWFLTTAGLHSIDADRLIRNPLPPPVAIRAVVADGSTYPDPRSLTLPENVSNLEIDYTALSLSVPERVRFRYRLDGVDRGWIDPGTRRQAFYTNMRPGHYVFQVIAANNDGVWNRTGASVTVDIPPTFLQSIWFKLLCALAIGALLWVAYTLRVQRIRARMRERLEERLAERERIARDLHDTLLQGFQGLILRFQSVANALSPEQPARQLIDQALDRADNVLIEGRDSVRQLRSPGQGDLAQLLAETAERLRDDQSATFSITVEGTPRRLHPVVLEELLRTGDEAIINAFRHAGATTIEVALIYHRQALRLVVCDDGIGIDPAIIEDGGREGHFGLVGMRERAQQISAEFVMSSRSGAGTEILVVVPGRIAFATARRFRWPLSVARLAEG